MRMLITLFGPDMGNFPRKIRLSLQDRGVKDLILKEYLFQDYINRGGMFSLVEGMGDKKECL